MPGLREFVEALLQSSFDETLDQAEWIFERLDRSNAHGSSQDGGIGKQFGKAGVLGFRQKAPHPLVSAAFDIDFGKKTALLKNENGVENLYKLALAYKNSSGADKKNKIDAIEKNDNKYAVCLALLYFYTNDKSKLNYRPIDEKNDYTKVALDELALLYANSNILKGKKLFDADQGMYLDLIKLKLTHHKSDEKNQPDEQKGEGSISSDVKIQNALDNASQMPIGASIQPQRSEVQDNNLSINTTVIDSVEHYPDTSKIGYSSEIEMDSISPETDPQPQSDENKVATLLNAMKASSVGFELEDKKNYELLTFEKKIKNFDISTLRYLSNYMHNVQHDIIKEPLFDDVRTEQSSIRKLFGKFANTTTWQTMRHKVKCELLSQRAKLNQPLTTDELNWLPQLFDQEAGRVNSLFGKTKSTKLLEISFPEVKQARLSK